MQFIFIIFYKWNYCYWDASDFKMNFSSAHFPQTFNYSKRLKIHLKTRFLFTATSNDCTVRSYYAWNYELLLLSVKFEACKHSNNILYCECAVHGTLKNIAMAFPVWQESNFGLFTKLRLTNMVHSIHVQCIVGSIHTLLLALITYIQFALMRWYLRACFAYCAMYECCPTTLSGTISLL